jgi:hypothetical protein
MLPKCNLEKMQWCERAKMYQRMLLDKPGDSTWRYGAQPGGPERIFLAGGDARGDSPDLEDFTSQGWAAQSPVHLPKMTMPSGIAKMFA